MTREEDLRRLLNDAATEIPAGNAPIAKLVREGRRSKKLRHIVQAASVAAAVAVIAVGAFILGPSVGGSGNMATQPTTTAPTSRVSQHGPAPTTATDNASELTSCSDVVSPSAGVEVNFWVDRTESILELSYSDRRTKNYIERSYTIAYKDDPTCRANPVINQLIERALASDRGDQYDPMEVDYPRVAGLFYRFAEDASRGGPFDTPVSLGLGNDFIRRVPSDSSEAAWVLDLTGYAERGGTMSVLELLRDNADNLQIVTEPQSRPPCAQEVDEPPTSLTGGGARISIQSQEPLDCTQWWSVDLFVNDVSQVVGVNVTLGSP